MTSYAHLLTGENVTRALAERIEAARRVPTVRCQSCLPTEACSQHLAAQLVEAVRQEDLVLMPRDEADAIIFESVRRLSGASDEQIRAAATPPAKVGCDYHEFPHAEGCPGPPVCSLGRADWVANHL